MTNPKRFKMFLTQRCENGHVTTIEGFALEAERGGPDYGSIYFGSAHDFCDVCGGAVIEDIELAEDASAAY